MVNVLAFHSIHASSPALQRSLRSPLYSSGLLRQLLCLHLPSLFIKKHRSASLGGPLLRWSPFRNFSFLHSLHDGAVGTKSSRYMLCFLCGRRHADQSNSACVNGVATLRLSVCGVPRSQAIFER